MTSMGALWASLPTVRGGSSPTKAFKPGEIMIEEDPYACSVDTMYLPFVCSYCIRRDTVDPCPHCKFANYCCNECKEKDSGYHALECKVLQENRNGGALCLNGEMRLVIRALERWIREREKGVKSVGDYFGHSRTFDDLLSHVDKMTSNELAAMQDLAATLHSLVGQHITTSIEEILVVIGKVRINCHALVDHNSPHGFVRGRAVYLAVSKMNHSCVEPNYVQIFNGRKYTLRALDNFEIQDPLVLTIHYVPPTLPLKTRRARLEKSYYFTCMCEKCLYEERHPEPPQADEEVVHRIEAAFQQRNSYTKWYNMGHSFLIELAHLPATNFYVNWILSQMQWTCQELGMHDESISFGTRALRGTESILALQRIFFSMCESMVVLGWNNPDHLNYGGFLEAHRLAKKMYILTHGKKHQIIVALDIMKENSSRIMSRIVRSRGSDSQSAEKRSIKRRFNASNRNRGGWVVDGEDGVSGPRSKDARG